MSASIVNPQVTAFLLLISWNLVLCSPLGFDGLPPVPIYAIPPMPVPMMLGQHSYQYDPYAAMSVPAQYMMNAPFNMHAQQASNRRSNGREKPQSDNNDNKTDEQKALEGLPVSFVSTSGRAC